MSKLLYVLVALALVVSSCEWNPIMWDESKVFIAFSTVSTDMPEDDQVTTNSDSVAIVVAVTALDGSPAVTVNFDFDTTGIDPEKAAFEDVDFTLLNADKILSFPNGWGYDTIWIKPIGNDIFTGNKEFNILLVSNSQDLQFGAAKSHAVTILDNEHPLSAWIGTYAVDAPSYGNPGPWDEAWTVTTSAVEGDITKLSILGIGTNGSSGTAIIGTIDSEAMTITIDPGQDSDAYGNYGYTESYVYYGNTDLTLDETAPLVGTIAADGSMVIDNFGIRVEFNGTDYGVWDVFKTTWTKTAKKAATRTTDVIKAERP